MGYKNIRDYGIIGDRHFAALVGLDDEKGGRFQVVPTTPYKTRQEYLRHTNILSTTFQTETGDATLIDLVPLTEAARPGQHPHEIHRILKADRGTVEVECLFQPRMDYGRAETRITSVHNGAMATGNGYSVALSSNVPLRVRGNAARARFALQEGDVCTFVVAYGRRRVLPVIAPRSYEKLQRTREYWEALVDQIKYEGMWKEEVIRSFLVLHLLMYSPTGAIVAAPTTSLPERIGGERNWDYRYSWLRDSAFTLGILYRLGDMREAHQYISWLVDKLRSTPGRTHKHCGKGGGTGRHLPAARPASLKPPGAWLRHTRQGHPQEGASGWGRPYRHSRGLPAAVQGRRDLHHGKAAPQQPQRASDGGDRGTLRQHGQHHLR